MSFDPFEEERGEYIRANLSYRSIPVSSALSFSILGMPGVGKSALVLRYCKNEFMNFYEPTIEDEFEKRIQIQQREVNLNILDTAGQEAFQALRNSWVAGKDGFILALDSTNPSFDELEEYYQLINTYTNNEQTKEIPIALVLTKADLLRPEGHSVADEAARIAEQRGWLFYRTSAKENIGITEVFENLVSSALRIPFAKSKKTHGAALTPDSSPRGKLPAQATDNGMTIKPQPVSTNEEPVCPDEEKPKFKPVKPPQNGPGGNFLGRLARIFCG